MRISADPAARRRLAALGAAAVLALIAGVTAGAGAGEDGERASETGAAAAQAREQGQQAALRQVDRLTLRQRVGQVTISSFSGTAAPEYMRRRLRARETAGVILFGGNGGDRAQWQRLTGSLQRAAGGRALVMVDQEGGDIRTVGYAGPHQEPAVPGPAAQRAPRRECRGSAAARRGDPGEPRAGGGRAAPGFGDGHALVRRRRARRRGANARLGARPPRCLGGSDREALPRPRRRPP